MFSGKDVKNLALIDWHCINRAGDINAVRRKAMRWPMVLWGVHIMVVYAVCWMNRAMYVHH